MIGDRFPERIARRVPLGLARTGTVGNNSSGDIFLAFSTANEQAFAQRGTLPFTALCGEVRQLSIATPDEQRAWLIARLQPYVAQGRVQQPF